MTDFDRAIRRAPVRPNPETPWLALRGPVWFALTVCFVLGALTALVTP